MDCVGNVGKRPYAACIAFCAYVSCSALLEGPCKTNQLTQFLLIFESDQHQLFKGVFPRFW